MKKKNKKNKKEDIKVLEVTNVTKSDAVKATDDEKGKPVTYVTTLIIETDDEVVKRSGLKMLKKGGKKTYYISLLDEFEVGDELELDFNEFDIVKRPFKTEKGKTIDCKWLHAN